MSEPPTCLCSLSCRVQRNTSGEAFYSCPKDFSDPHSCGFFQLKKDSMVIEHTVQEDFVGKECGEGDDSATVGLELSAYPIVQDPLEETTDLGLAKTGSPQKHCLMCGTYGHVASACPARAMAEDTGTWAQQLMPPPPPLNAKPQSTTGECFFCKEQGHWANECPKKNEYQKQLTTCFRCLQPGHWAKNCPLKRSSWAYDKVKHHHQVHKSRGDYLMSNKETRDESTEIQDVGPVDSLLPKRQKSTAATGPPSVDGTIPDVSPSKDDGNVNADHVDRIARSSHNNSVVRRKKKLPLWKRGGGGYCLV